MTQAVVPYDSRPLERVEFSQEQIKVLKNTICRGASDAELQLFTYACQDIGLNPFLHQIWAIMRNVKVGNAYEKQLTIQVGIDGYRLIRDRIRDAAGMPLFEGMDGPQWSADGEKWLDYEYSPQPKFARVAVWRRGIPRPFVAVCRWEAYVQETSLWQKMGAEQLAKCAESLALRRAFPAEMSGLPAEPVAEYEGHEVDEAPPEYIEGQISEPEPEPITDEQRKKITALYQGNLKDKAMIAALRERWPHAFGQTMNKLNALSAVEAAEVIALIEHGEQEKAEQAATDPADASPPVTPSPPPPVCEHSLDEHDRCKNCGLTIQEIDNPPPLEEQPALV